MWGIRRETKSALRVPLSRCWRPPSSGFPEPHRLPPHPTDTPHTAHAAPAADKNKTGRKYEGGAHNEPQSSSECRSHSILALSASAGRSKRCILTKFDAANELLAEFWTYPTTLRCAAKYPGCRHHMPSTHPCF